MYLMLLSIYTINLYNNILNFIFISKEEKRKISACSRADRL